MLNRIQFRLAAAAFSLAAAFSIAADRAAAVELADNLAGATAGTESATPARWLAAAFATEGQASYRLSSVTLLLASTSPGEAVLELHEDGGLEPGALVATLTSPASLPDVLAAATFDAGGIPLDAGATYWVVLRALGGELAWAWTTSNTGSGAGFQTAWDLSEDAGSAWFTHDIYPLQLRVTVSATDPTMDCNGNGVDDRIDIENGTSLDCNANAAPDECDLAAGDSADANANGLPDDCEPAFLRGDANCDGKTDISDAVWTLAHLFSGGPAPCCGDAADGNDDGKVDISDPIRVLTFLFQGAAAPPAPGPDLPCGIDLTSDGNEASLPCLYPLESCSELPAGG